MTEDVARSLFTLAGFDVIRMKPLPDGYGYPVSDHRYFEEPPRVVWWFVKTQFGWIEIGPRKRVIAIDWTDVGGPFDVTNDDVTKNGTLVHAATHAKAIEYLTRLRELLKEFKS
jgi:hypothetical protein